MDNTPDISIVVPVYNGAATLEELTRRTQTAMQNSGMSFELLLIDDGSRDNSWQVIKDINKNYGSVIRGFRLARNSGQQAATICGLLQAKAPWIVTLDDDLQSAPEDIALLLDAGKESDIVYGTYTSPKHNFLHTLGTRIFWYIFHRIAPHFPPTSSFRLIRSSIITAMPDALGPWVFVDPMLSWLTGNISSVQLVHAKNGSGRSRYSFGKLLSLAITMMIVYSTWPLRLMIGTGFLASSISFTTGLYFLYKKLTVGAAVGFSAIIVTVSFASGIILLSLGILGEYIARIYDMGSRRPAYIIQATT